VLEGILVGIIDASLLRKAMQYCSGVDINFDKPETKDFTETVRLLAGLSKFVIADITNPKSAPLELQATVPEIMVPFRPIIEEGQKPLRHYFRTRGSSTASGSSSLSTTPRWTHSLEPSMRRSSSPLGSGSPNSW
jgi:hypothetical protein